MVHCHRVMGCTSIAIIFVPNLPFCFLLLFYVPITTHCRFKAEVFNHTFDRWPQMAHELVQHDHILYSVTRRDADWDLLPPLAESSYTPVTTLILFPICKDLFTSLNSATKWNMKLHDTFFVSFRNILWNVNYTLAPDVKLCMTYKGKVKHGLGMGTNDLHSTLWWSRGIVAFLHKSVLIY